MSHAFSRARTFVLFVLLAAASRPLTAEITDSERAEQRRRIEAQIDALEKDSPIAQQLRQVSAELEAIAIKQNEVQRKTFERLQQLQETEAYRAYVERRIALEQERQRTWEGERDEMAEVAKRLYATRHDELRKLTAPPLVEGPKLQFDVLSYPRLDGSTSAHPLSVIVASRLLGLPYRWEYPKPTGRPWGPPQHERLEELYLPRAALFVHGTDEFNLASSRVVAHAGRPNQERVAMMINSLLAVSTTTHDALINLGAGTCDLVLTVRPPTAAERKAAADRGQEIRLEPVAREALVFFVNHKSPVKSLAMAQLQSIYAMKTKRWNAVGGPDTEIRALMREPESGSRELFDSLVMKGIAQPDDDSRRELFQNSMAGPFNRVTTDESAIGYSVFYYDRYMALSPFTRTIAVDGIEPTRESIASGKYPLVFPLYAATRAVDAPDSAARKLLAWLRSDEGQAVVRESGYVTLK